jgi:hypothetical protein
MTAGGKKFHAFARNETIASIDTIWFFADFFPERIVKMIPDNTENGWLKPCQLDNGYRFGFLLCLQQPSLTIIEAIAAVQERCKIKISRLNIAFDFLSENCEGKGTKTLWLKEHILLRYRRKGRLLEQENTLTWNSFAGRKASNRNLIIYDDRQSKLGGSECTHVELRFLNSASVARLGLSNFMKLIDLDPSNLFAKVIKLTAFDLDEFSNRNIRRNYKSWHIKKDTELAEHWNSNLLKRLRRQYRIVYQGCVQRAKDILGAKVGQDVLDPSLLKLPIKLSWHGNSRH